jgi:hypothetical protein
MSIVGMMQYKMVRTQLHILQPPRTRHSVSYVKRAIIMNQKMRGRILFTPMALFTAATTNGHNAQDDRDDPSLGTHYIN